MFPIILDIHHTLVDNNFIFTYVMKPNIALRLFYKIDHLL